MADFDFPKDIKLFFVHKFLKSCSAVKLYTQKQCIRAVLVGTNFFQISSTAWPHMAYKRDLHIDLQVWPERPFDHFS